MNVQFQQESLEGIDILLTLSVYGIPLFLSPWNISCAVQYLDHSNQCRRTYLLSACNAGPADHNAISQSVPYGHFGNHCWILRLTFKRNSDPSAVPSIPVRCMLYVTSQEYGRSLSGKRARIMLYDISSSLYRDFGQTRTLKTCQVHTRPILVDHL